MCCYTVIDTNVLVSALLSKNVNASTVQVLEELFKGTVIPVYNDEIMQEYSEVLSRPKFAFSENVIRTVLQAVADNGIYVERISTDEVLPDPKDLVFYEVVMAKRGMPLGAVIVGIR